MLPATFCAGMTLPLLTRTLLGGGRRRAGDRRGVRREHAGLDRRRGRSPGWCCCRCIGPQVDAGRRRGARHGSRGGAPEPRSAAGRAGGARLLLAAAVGRGGRAGMGGLRHPARPRPADERGLSLAEAAGARRSWRPFYRDGRTATVSVVRGRSDDRLFLATNGKPDASLGPEWLRTLRRRPPAPARQRRRHADAAPARHARARPVAPGRRRSSATARACRRTCCSAARRSSSS